MRLGQGGSGWSTVVLSAFSALAVGCADSTAPTQNENDGDAFALALMGMGGAPPTTWSGTHTTPCPGGGSRTSSGSATHDNADGVFSSTWNYTTTMTACVTVVDTFRFEMSGQLQADGHSRFRVPAQSGSAPVILEMESRSRGQTTTIQNGRSMTCSHDIRQLYDASSNQTRLVGTSCGRAIDLTMPITR